MQGITNEPRLRHYDKLKKKLIKNILLCNLDVHIYSAAQFINTVSTVPFTIKFSHNVSSFMAVFFANEIVSIRELEFNFQIIF